MNEEPIERKNAKFTNSLDLLKNWGNNFEQIPFEHNDLSLIISDYQCLYNFYQKNKDVHQTKHDQLDDNDLESQYQSTSSNDDVKELHGNNLTKSQEKTKELYEILLQRCTLLISFYLALLTKYFFHLWKKFNRLWCIPIFFALHAICSFLFIISSKDKNYTGFCNFIMQNLRETIVDTIISSSLITCGAIGETVSSLFNEYGSYKQLGWSGGIATIIVIPIIVLAFFFRKKKKK